MKIRSRLLNKLVGVAGACAVRGWMNTVSYRVHSQVPHVDPGHPRHRGHYIYAFWHEFILTMIGVRRVRRTSVLISRHQDGEYVAQIVERLGIDVVRGSSTRGSQAGLLGMLRRAEEGNHLLITPDGPRGPRRRLQSGAIFLASRSGLPIAPVGFGVTHAWRARSWDRFAVPHPYSLVTCVVGDPISVPPGLDAAGTEWWRSRVESALLAWTDSAQQWSVGQGGPQQPVKRQAA